jgi:hypothetical protein
MSFFRKIRDLQNKVRKTFTLNTARNLKNAAVGYFIGSSASSVSSASSRPPPIPPSPFISQTYTNNIRNIGTNTNTYTTVITEYDYKTPYSDGWYIFSENVKKLQPLSSSVLANGILFRMYNWSKNIYLYRDDGTIMVNSIPTNKFNVPPFNYINFKPIFYDLTYFQIRSEPLPTTSYIRIVQKIDNIISETMYPYGSEPIKLGPFKPNDTIVIYFAYNSSNYLPNLFIDEKATKLSMAMNYQRDLVYETMNAYKYLFNENMDSFYLIPSQQLPLKFFAYRNNIPLNYDLSYNTDCNPIPKLENYSLLPTNNPEDYNTFNGSGLYVNLFTDFECKIKANENDSVKTSTMFGYNNNIIAYNENQNANYYKLSNQPVPIIQPQMFDSVDASGSRIYVNPDDPSLCMKLPFESTPTNITSTSNNGYDISYYTDDVCTNQYIDAQYNIDVNEVNNTDYTPTTINGEIIENSNALYFRVYKQP